MKDSKPVVVGIGELLWDVLPTGKRAGGAPINFVYHATQLGAEGYAVSAVGNDVFGTEIVQELDKNGICHLLGTVEYPTGSVMVELKDGMRYFPMPVKRRFGFSMSISASLTTRRS